MSWKPRAFVWHGFLSDDEADHIRNLAAPRMERSGVVNYDGSNTPDHDIRTSYGTFLKPAEDEVIRDIDLRVSKWVHVPASHSEAIQVLRYEFNQTYGGHWDELDPTNDASTVGGGSPRMATVLMYLADTEQGGETAFPHSLWIDKEIQSAGQTYSECTNGGVSVKPKKGDALLFFGLKVDVGRLEPFSLHAGCPVIKGIKWTAVKWIHTQPFLDPQLYGEVPPSNKAGTIGQAPQVKQWPNQETQQKVKVAVCVDKDSRCEAWAAKGECEKNSKFMIGAKSVDGTCLKSCGLCSCPVADVLCERKLEGMRRRLGLNKS